MSPLRERYPLPPACGGEGLGMGGGKAGLLSVIVAPSGAAPPSSPPHRKRGEGVALRRRALPEAAA
jgi:hypothetical protein